MWSVYGKKKPRRRRRRQVEINVLNEAVPKRIMELRWQVLRRLVTLWLHRATLCPGLTRATAASFD